MSFYKLYEQMIYIKLKIIKIKDLEKIQCESKIKPNSCRKIN